MAEALSDYEEIGTPWQLEPDYREIDTPWKPESIAWRQKTIGGTPIRNKREIRQEIVDLSRTHIVREVEVLLNYTPLPDIEAIKAICARTDEQFAILQDVSQLRVAETEWHVFNDADNNSRVLARVEIIDGTPDFSRTGRKRLSTEMRKYKRPPGELALADITSAQFLFGKPRTAGRRMSRSAFFLVDIEPILKRIS